MVSSMCGRIALSGGTQHTGITARASAMWMKCVLGWLFARWMRQRRRANASTSEMRVPTVVGTAFAGVKRSQDEAEVCEELSSVKSTRSLDTASSDMARQLAGGLVGRVLRTARCIAHWCLGWSWWEVRRCMTKTCARWNQPLWTWGKTLLNAQENCCGLWREVCGESEFRGFGCNGIGGATASSHSQASTRTWDKRGWELVDWLKRLSIPSQNRLSDHGRYSKCLMSHRVLELVLDALSLTEMQRHMEIAIDLKMLAKGTFPSNLKSLNWRARRRRRKKTIWDLNGNKYQQTVWFWWKVWRLAMWKQIATGRRLLTRERGLESLMQAVDPANIRATLQTTIRLALEHLRTLDVERQYCDRYDGTLASANYDIWIWLWVVEW